MTKELEKLFKTYLWTKMMLQTMLAGKPYLHINDGNKQNGYLWEYDQ